MSGDGKFLFVADDPSLDFLNTVLVHKGELVDLLQSFTDLVEWLKTSPLRFEIPHSFVKKWKGTPQAEDSLAAAKRFRGVLADMIAAIVKGKRVPETAVTEINKHLARRNGHPIVFRKNGAFIRAFRYEMESPAHLLAPIAEAAANLLSTADFSLIRKCENERCVLYFYDTTKNHARRWCSMSICGNRNKVSAYYERQRKKL